MSTQLIRQRIRETISQVDATAEVICMAPGLEEMNEMIRIGIFSCSPIILLILKKSERL